MCPELVNATPVATPASTPVPTPAEAAALPAENTNNAVADLKDKVENGTPAEKAEAKKTLKQLKIKFNGKEYTEDLPFEIPDDDKAREYMTKQLQLSKQAATKAQDYSELEKEVRSFVEELKKNPRRVLSDPNICVDINQLADQIIEEEIQNSQKSPEQLEKEKLEAELRSIKEEREKEKKELQEKEFERVQAQEFERYDMLITQAIEKSDLPKSPYIVKKMADYLLLGIQEGLDVSPDDVLPLVREEMQNDLKEMFALMPEEVVEQIVGKDVINKIRKKQVAKAKQGPASNVSNVKKEVESPSGKKSEAGEKKSFKEFFGI